MKTRPHIRFALRLSKPFTPATRTPESSGSICCSITVRGKTTIFSTGLVTSYGLWDSHAHRVLGRSIPARQANEQIAKITDRLNDLAADLDRQDKAITAVRLRQLYQRNGASFSMLELYRAFQLERKTLVGIEISPATVRKETVRYNRLAEFLAAHKLTDLRPEEFTTNLADKLLYWLQKERSLKRNSANNIIKTAGQVLRWGVRREHLDKNPLALYQLKNTASEDIKYLTVGELADLSTARLAIACLERVRDCFVFQCWTGLAYADLAALDLTAVEYHRQADETLLRVLRVRRAKSTTFKGYECVIPLLPEAERILALYNDRLPVPTNQVYNRYLKQVGELCGLAVDKMTTHVGRKTAGTLLFNLGVPLPVVSKILGHANTIITQQLYAKLLDTTVVDALSGLFGAGLAAELPPPLPLPLAVSTELRPARRLFIAPSQVQKGGAAL